MTDSERDRLLHKALAGVDAEIELLELEHKTKMDALAGKRRALLSQMAPASALTEGRGTEEAGPKGLQEMITRVLAKAETAWMKTSEIVAALQAQYGERIASNSVSSTLTILKDKGLIERHGRLVALATRVANSKGPTT